MVWKDWKWGDRGGWMGRRGIGGVGGGGGIKSKIEL